MNYKNYLSQSNNIKPNYSNLISECLVDYFIGKGHKNPFDINTTIYNKVCSIYLPKCNQNEVTEYLFDNLFWVMNTLSKINFFEKNFISYDDYMSYGTYYGYGTKETIEKLPKGKVLSNEIIKNIESINDDSYEYSVWLTYNTEKDEISKVNIYTTGKLIKSEILEIINNLSHIEEENIKIVQVDTFEPTLTTNDTLKYYFNEIPTSNNHMIGKDPNHPSRILPLYLRYISKNLVSSSLMDKCLITLNYHQDNIVPHSININDYGTSIYNERDIYSCFMDVFPLSLKEIKLEIDFNQTIYKESCLENYFFKDTLPWESTTKAKDLILF